MRSKAGHPPLIPALALCVFALGLSALGGCATDDGPELAVSPFASGELTSILPDAPAPRLNDPFIREGVKALEAGDYPAANKAFGRALKFDPQNANLHFLNALAYQLRGDSGDASQYELAEVGYRVALQFDSGNYMAASRLGRLKFREQKFREAQDALAYALLFTPEDANLLRAMAGASYYAQDIATAQSAINKALRLGPRDPDTLRAAAIIEAAAGDIGGARELFREYKEAERDAGFRQAILSKRIDDWRDFHLRSPYLHLIQDADAFAPGTDSGGFGGDDDDSGGFGPSDDDGGFGPNDGDDDDDTGDGDAADAGKKAAKKKKIPDMCLVDVAIIRSEERYTSGKGVNLLQGLNITFSGTFFDLVRGLPRTTTGTPRRQFTLSFPTADSTTPLNYSLNIFSSQDDRNEVLARPTLVALDGKKSKFFAGAVFHVEIGGAAGSQGTITDVPVGIDLAIQPKFLDRDTVQLQVSAAREYLEDQSGGVNYNNFSQTTKTHVTANVALRFGETLVLSGLSEKENETVKSGVPLLKDIPGIQYAFSREDTVEITKSVLILLTPRKPRYTFRDGTERRDAGAKGAAPGKNLKELKSRADWFQPAPNLDAVFHHLSRRENFKEYRAGDVKLERWDDPDDLIVMIERTLNFLYY